MSALADVYTPWREDPACLRQRHVGREEQLRAIRAAIGALLQGEAPVHLYFFGPRGMGKSHLISLAHAEAAPLLAEHGVSLVVVPEDIPELGSTAAILARIAEIRAGPRWQRFGVRPAPPPPLQGPIVIFFEGLERQLRALPEQERRNLRASLDQARPVLLIGTGVTLSEPFTSRETAFYGAFSSWPVAPLHEEEAGHLLDQLAGPATTLEGWPARRRALITLSGGSPRTLVSLGGACARAPDAWASEQLYSVVQQFTAHYQLRFLDLSAQKQSIVELLAMAPRELTPTEIGELLGIGVSQASGQCQRLLDDGVVLSRSEGRATWYRLAEPLFRFWMEYRNAPWEETRVGWLGRLLEAVLAANDLVQMWLENPDPDLQGAVDEVLNRNQRRRLDAWNTLAERFRGAVQGKDGPERLKVLARIERSTPPLGALLRMVRSAGPGLRDVRAELTPYLERLDVGPVPVAWAFEDAILEGWLPREALKILLQRLNSSLGVKVAPRAVWDEVQRVVLSALNLTAPQGRSWVLDVEERVALARIPVLRASFLLQGKRTTHLPLLSPADILLYGADLIAVDWDLLLSAATRLSDVGLVTALLQVALRGRKLPLLPPCPDPARVATGPVEDWAQLLTRSLRERPERWPHALSWAATLGQASDPLFQDLRRELHGSMRVFADSPLLMGALSSALDLALLALGARAPTRLAALAEGLGEETPFYLRVDRALLLGGQIRHAGQARLYPELAEITRMFS